MKKIDPWYTPFFSDVYKVLLTLLLFKMKQFLLLPSLPHTLSHEQMHIDINALRSLAHPHILGMYINPFIGLNP